MLMAAYPLIGAMLLILNAIAVGIEAFSNEFDWGLIKSNIDETGATLNAFMNMISNVSSGFIKKSFMLMAAYPLIGMMMGLMSQVAAGLDVFSNVNGDNLLKVGLGISYLSNGLFKYIKALSMLKGLDINYLTKIDVTKLSDLGNALSLLSVGMIDLSSGEINFQNMISQVKSAIIPLAAFTFVLDKFNKVYSTFGTIAKSFGLEEKMSMSFDVQNGLQEQLVNLQKQELEIQTLQLNQLQENGRLLAIIASRSINGGENMIPALAGGSNNAFTSIRTPEFSTKQNWIDNMNGTSMALI